MNWKLLERTIKNNSEHSRLQSILKPRQQVTFNVTRSCWKEQLSIWKTLSKLEAATSLTTRRQSENFKPPSRSLLQLSPKKPQVVMLLVMLLSKQTPVPTSLLLHAMRPVSPWNNPNVLANLPKVLPTRTATV